MAEDVQADLVQIVKVDITREGINWEQIPDLAVVKVAWRELTALCAISTGGSKVRSKEGNYPTGLVAKLAMLYDQTSS